MKQLFLGVVIISLVAVTSPVAAQQSINVGTPSSDLQQNVGNEYFQLNNTGGQPAGNITENAGAALLQNTPSQPLDVSGAPADSASQETETNSFRWVLFFGLFLLVLLSPALLYRRELQATGELTDDVIKEAVKPTAKPQTDDVATASIEAPVKKQVVNEPKKSKKKSKNKSANKAKRGKKKK